MKKDDNIFTIEKYSGLLDDHHKSILQNKFIPQNLFTHNLQEGVIRLLPSSCCLYLGKSFVKFFSPGAM